MLDDAGDGFGEYLYLYLLEIFNFLLAFSEPFKKQVAHFDDR